LTKSGGIGKRKRIGGLSVANFSLISSLWRCLLPLNPLSGPLASRCIFLSSHSLLFVLYTILSNFLRLHSASSYPLFVGETSQRARSHPCNRGLPPNSIHRSRFCRRQGIPFPAHASLVFQENLSYILPTFSTAKRYPRYLTHVGSISFTFWLLYYIVFFIVYDTIRWKIILNYVDIPQCVLFTTTYTFFSIFLCNTKFRILEISNMYNV